MSGYVIDDVPTAQVRSDASDVLGESDSIQESLMAEAVIQVSENDEVIGPISKFDSHYKVGTYHRAFSVLLFDSSGRLLLQRRASHKITFPDVWANSCCSHPLHSDEELEMKNNLGVKRAAIRKLEQELGISPSQVPLDKFDFVTKMRYQARQDDDWIEREVDHCLVIHADVDVNPNPNEVSEIKWVSQAELEEMLLAEDPENVIAPWFRCIAARIMNDDWWRPGCVKPDGLIHDMGDVSHMLPNAIGPIIVVAAANFAAAILIEAGLSFLGVGAQIPVPSWGNIIKEHYHLLTSDLAWLAIIPGVLIASLVLAFTWLGDGLRVAFEVNK